MSAPLLEVEGLTKRFGGLVANEDVSFAVGEGEIVGLIGPNGAGKTTVFNSLAGFFAPSSGEIRLGGLPIAGLPPEAVAALGVARTFQIVRIFKSMTVLENAMVGAMLRHRAVPAAARLGYEMLRFTGLERRAHEPASRLTVAEQKRLEIARALATGPRLLLLDEVMAGLTPSEVQEAVEMVKRIRDRGIACVVVEHVMEGIMPIADRMLVLERGRKIAEGPPAAIASDPAVIAAYLGEEYRAPGA
ncbi:MAG TPA: ABC transporter ATP-binding protein [Anaeromyxobacteraceae bacterium]|nr:ABC transporter ATP-binding protein [Anaeromyxobacteraceae bacterium]